ncbi:MAG: hypothetical protein M1829_004983 [Trizodia sp. TS-e1964]|nr:MAG: hypothetical protein M1829_004983 [Trizodia sp. TS-e1964]
MDTLLPELLSFPPHPPRPLTSAEYDHQARNIIQILNKIPFSHYLNGLQGDIEILDILDPSINSLPFLYTLIAYIQAAYDGLKRSSGKIAFDLQLMGPLWNVMVRFLQSFDPAQMRYVGNEWRRIVEVVASVARHANKPIVAIRPIRDAILRLDPTSSMFTSTHLMFLRLCLEAKSYRAAVPILDKDIFNFPAKFPTHHNSPIITASSGHSTKLEYTDHLEYHLFGATIYMCLKNWERAQEFLSYVICCPTSGGVFSGIMIEGYKKWLLVGLIKDGISPPLPKFVTNGGMRIFHYLARAYENVALLFRLGDFHRLEAEIAAGSDIWHHDQTTGLMQLVTDAFIRHDIRNLGNTYCTLSVRQICMRHRSSSNEILTPERLQAMERTILDLIARGELNATLSYSVASSQEQEAMVTFESPAASSVTCSELSKLEAVQRHGKRILELTAQIRAVDERMSNSKEFSAWRMREQRGHFGRGDGGFVDDPMDFRWDTYGMDEELMDGI